MKPDASGLPPDAFDDKGDIKKAFYEVSTSVAYPEGHSVWSKLEPPADAETWTVDVLKDWLLKTHGLKLTAWNLPCGETTDDDGAKRSIAARVRRRLRPVSIGTRRRRLRRGLDGTRSPRARRSSRGSARR